MHIPRRFLALAAAALLGVLPATMAYADKTIRVGIMGGEDEDVWAVASQEAKKHGLNLKLVVFNDYTQPNEALQNGELDANAFQHSRIWTTRSRAAAITSCPWATRRCGRSVFTRTSTVRWAICRRAP